MTPTYEEIRQLYMERLAGLFTAADEAHFQALLETDATTRNVVSQLDQENIENNAQAFLGNIDEEKALKQARYTLEKSKTTNSFNWGRWTAAAAVLLVLTFAAIFFIAPSKSEKKSGDVASIKNIDQGGVQLKLGDGQSVALGNDSLSHTIVVGDMKLVTNNNSLQAVTGEASSKINILTVPAKEDYKIVLDDGTKVWVNSASQLHFPFRFTGSTREVTVTGEAYFEVAKDASRPFIVHAGTTKIEVLGTHFNVNAYSGKSVKTSLVEGKVQLSTANAKNVKLVDGFEAVLDPSKGFVLSRFDADDALSWIKGTYYFHEKSLSAISEIIPRWFDVQVVFDRPELMNYQISGLLEKNQLQGFLKDLETSAQINYYFQDKTLHFK